MGNARSLQDIMHDVSASLDNRAAVAPVTVSADSEMQAFIQLDPLLASLHKQYVDAREMRRKSEKDFGRDDAMTEIAVLTEDSAWCAMQTRYMELREERRMIAAAQELIEEERLAANRKREEENSREALQNYYRMDMMMKAKKKEETGYYVWLAAFMLFMGWGEPFRLYQPMHQFNRLAA